MLRFKKKILRTSCCHFFLIKTLKIVRKCVLLNKRHTDMHFLLSGLPSDHVLDEGTFDLLIPVLVKAATGGPNKGRNVSHVTQDSTYKYVQDHRGTLYRGGQTAFLPARLQHLKKFLSCHMKPIKNIYFLPSKENPHNLPQPSLGQSARPPFFFSILQYFGTVWY